MTCNHIDNEETVRDDPSRRTATQRLNHEPSHIIRQLPPHVRSIPVQGTPCAIFKDMAQPAVVRFAELELRPGDLGLDIECPINNVKC